MTYGFHRWVRLVCLNLAGLRECGMFPAVYALRDGTTRELLKFGSCRLFRNRIFGNYIGGISEDKTSQRLYDTTVIGSAEIAWLEGKDEAEARQKEKEFRASYIEANGKRPQWDLRN